MKKIAAIAAAFLLTACSSFPAAVVNTPPSAKTVALVVLVPPEIGITTYAPTFYSDHLDVVPVADWHLDDVAAASAMAALPPRFQVVRATMDAWPKDDNDKAYKNDAVLEKEVTARVHPSAPVDFYVVISCAEPMTSRLFKPRFVPVGASQTQDVYTIFKPYVHTFLQVAILDGKTGKFLAKTPFGLPSDRFDAYVAAMSLEGFDWKTDWRSMTKDQQTLIHDKLIELLKTSTSFTVGKHIQWSPTGS